MLIGLPKFEQITGLMTSIDEGEMLRSDIQRKAMGLTKLTETLGDKEVEFATLTGDFYPLLASQEIGNQFTQQAEGNGLTVRSLNIGEIKTPATLSTYIGTGDAGITATSGNATTTSVGAQVTGSYDDIESEGTEQTVAPVQDTSDTSNLIYQTNVSMTLTGDIGNLQKFIDEVFTIPGVLVNTWRGTVQQNADVGFHTYQLEMTVFMAADFHDIMENAGMTIAGK